MHRSKTYAYSITSSVRQS